MAVPVGIWLALIGYAIAWAGWRNSAVSYSAQSDGSIKASGQTYSLRDAFTCGRGTAAQGQPGTPGSAGATPATPTPAANALPAPNPIGQPNLQPAPLPGYAPVYLAPFPNPQYTPPPAPRPGLLDALGAGGVVVVQDLGSLLGRLRGGHFSPPRLPPLQLPRLPGFNL